MNELMKTDTMSSLQIAEITGKQHAHVMRDIRNLLDQGVTESNFGLSEYQDSTGRTLPCYELTKKGCLILASGYNALLREKIIDRWEELETERIQPNYLGDHFNPVLRQAEAQVFLIEQISRNLRLNDISRLGMYQELAAQNGLTIPSYVKSKGVLKSARDLLKEGGYGIGSQKFNERLAAHGFIESKSRTAAGGKEKRFWSITEKGLPYGENGVSPHNPNETQPRWYEDKFKELFNLIEP